MNKYKLTKDGDAVVCEDIMEWGRWFEDADRIVAKTPSEGGDVSTVFLGIDYGHDEGKPILWETMVFGGKLDQECERYTSKEDAIEGHKNMVNLVEQGLA